MNAAFLLIGVVIVICILMDRFLEKLPIPPLLFFIALGMCFGENGLLRIPFDDYVAVNLICSVSLIFIMFYGGFGTNLQAARPVLAQSAILSTLGVAGTAGAVAVFAHLALQLPWLESLLIGSVISSTDSASVFNILRSNKLALKHHTDSLLEVESGSNDPMSYMLTTVTLSLMAGQDVSIPWLLLQQISRGVLFGLLTGAAVVWLLRQNFVDSQQRRTVLLFAAMLLAYALPAVLGGNGYLGVYLCGIWLGNAKLTQKRYLVYFFDVLTNVCQVIIFFLLGLLVTPVELPAVLLRPWGSWYSSRWRPARWWSRCCWRLSAPPPHRSGSCPGPGCAAQPPSCLRSRRCSAACPCATTSTIWCFVSCCSPSLYRGRSCRGWRGVSE